MSYTKIILADRLVLPLREAAKRTLKHPFVQLSYHAQETGSDSDPTFVLLGFRRDEIINNFHDFLFISNPTPTVERKSQDIIHCLSFIRTDGNILIIEGDSRFGLDEIENIVSHGISCVIESSKLSNQDDNSINFFIKSDDRPFFEDSLKTNQNFEDALIQMTDRFTVQKATGLGGIAIPKRKAKSGRLSRHMVFDQQ